MDEAKQKNLTTAAKFLMIFLLISLAAQVLVYYQLAVLMIKPMFFSETFIATVKETGPKTFLVCVAATAVAWLFYFFKKPIVTIIIVMLIFAYIQTRYSIKEIYGLQKTTFFHN
jgi:hypothetical protein